MHRAIVGRVEWLPVEFVSEYGEATVGLVTHHLPVAVLKRDLAPLAVESVAIAMAGRLVDRRDFTINGLFLDPRSGEVHDFVGGREDLARGIVRCIGVPAMRFGEDHLRMLRAVRFTAFFDLRSLF
jgi:poly(A) polymerase